MYDEIYKEYRAYIRRKRTMKIFVSWSGELSKQIAQELKTWLPCFFDAVEVFYSPKDIAKGDEWDAKIIQELSESSYGIVCLTSENTNAPWINFEAGAITNALNSKVAPLMVDIKPSDIKGPLKRYQGTRLEKDDMRQLIFDINEATEKPSDKTVLETRFNAMWDTAYAAIKKCIDDYSPAKIEDAESEPTAKNDAIEEILQLIRKQNALLNTPEQLLPEEYIRTIMRKRASGVSDTVIMDEMIDVFERFIEDLYETQAKGVLEETSKMTLKSIRVIEVIWSIFNILTKSDSLSVRSYNRISKLTERVNKLVKVLY